MKLYTLLKLIAVSALSASLIYGQPPPGAPRELNVVIGKALVIDSPVDVLRVSVADPATVEAVGISPNEVLLNGKAVGQTSVIVWQKGGNRLFFEVTVRPRGEKKVDVIRRELAKEFPDLQVDLTDDTAFLRGTVDNLTASDRAAAIASSLGGKETKLVNLLNVNVPEIEPQILLKVRFADINRQATQELGVNLFSTGAGNTIGRTTTGQFGPPLVNPAGTFGISDALNVFLFRPDLDLGATIKALEARRLLEILAEPNVLAANGKEAFFLAGGEYPYPLAQGGGLGGVPVITLQFKEFGIRLSFTPYITSRGTIRLQVNPEVSALDYANGLSLQGFNVPGIAARRVSTEIELADRQSFAIAGLLDNRLIEDLNKVPGLANIPLLGKLFQSRSVTKTKQELLVLVTPEIVRPVPADQKPPEIPFSGKFLTGGLASVPKTPGTEQTGPAPQLPRKSVPVEVLIEEKKQEQEKRQQGGGASTQMSSGYTATKSGTR